MACPFTAAQCQTVIASIIAAMGQPGIKSISDPIGGTIQFTTPGEAADALTRWQALYNQAAGAEQPGGRQAIAIERRRAV
jgi:hypothetical protein